VEGKGYSNRLELVAKGVPTICDEGECNCSEAVISYVEDTVGGGVSGERPSASISGGVRGVELELSEDPGEDEGEEENGEFATTRELSRRADPVFLNWVLLMECGASKSGQVELLPLDNFRS